MDWNSKPRVEVVSSESTRHGWVGDVVSAEYDSNGSPRTLSVRFPQAKEDPVMVFEPTSLRILEDASDEDSETPESRLYTVFTWYDEGELDELSHMLNVVDRAAWASDVLNRGDGDHLPRIYVAEGPEDAAEKHLNCLHEESSSSDMDQHRGCIVVSPLNVQVFAIKARYSVAGYQE